MEQKLEYGKVYDFYLGDKEIKVLYIGKLSRGNVKLRYVVLNKYNGRVYARRFRDFEINGTKLKTMEFSFSDLTSAEREYADKLLTKAGL